MAKFTRGFTGRSRERDARLPPGPYDAGDQWPVLTAEVTPQIDLDTWSFSVEGFVEQIVTWTWDEIQALPASTYEGDIHCVTTWSKFDTTWEGVTIDDLLAAAGVAAPSDYTLAISHDDYDTNVPAADLLNGRAMVATRFNGAPLAAEHGGPARLLVPHLYLWKSAKWIKGLRFTARDEAGFWELRGYHMRGDPWKHQRYSDDP
jgi:DMSO/TMAO reductase YedYZ molybdopterin-dependent catalytic subunit